MRAYSHQAYVRPRCRRRAASLTPFHSLRVGNAGGQLVWNVRTWPAMPREKAQAAPTARLKVPMRRRGADCFVVAMKRGNARGAKRSPFERLWVAGKIDLECVPQGTFAERIRAGGAGIAAFYTPVGFGTELAGGKEVRCFDGREHVLEQAIKGDLALVRADTADRYGNLTFRYAQINFGPVMAMAAKLAVAEVRTVLDAPIPHDRVQLPGVFVDRVVAAGK